MLMERGRAHADGGGHVRDRDRMGKVGADPGDGLGHPVDPDCIAILADGAVYVNTFLGRRSLSSEVTHAPA